ncbi:MAG: hypothetical protein JW751_13455 [Polyangiaceae bacterium]|nr:hypothetical protein [Polyangiaceae bacterium]
MAQSWSLLAWYPRPVIGAMARRLANGPPKAAPHAPAITDSLNSTTLQVDHFAAPTPP